MGVFVFYLDAELKSFIEGYSKYNKISQGAVCRVALANLMRKNELG